MVMARGKTTPEELGIDLVHLFETPTLQEHVFSPRAIIRSRILKSGNSIYKRSIQNVTL